MPESGPPQNENRRRWYGVRPGDEVNFMGHAYAVVSLHLLDNNGCTLRDLATGKEYSGVCEWCTITRKVEDIRA